MRTDSAAAATPAPTAEAVDAPVPAQLLRLLQLASPALPIGGYAYSQGLEWLIQQQTRPDPDAVERWLVDALRLAQGHFELPILARQHAAWLRDDSAGVTLWDDWYRAGIDSAEGMLETVQMGQSLRQLLMDLGLPERCATLPALHRPTLPTVYAAAAVGWDIDVRWALSGFAWSWLENQVAVALKALPLGQVAGQRMLTRVSAAIPAVVEAALQLEDDAIENGAPMLTLARCGHETLYSRLFRS